MLIAAITMNPVEKMLVPVAATLMFRAIYALLVYSPCGHAYLFGLIMALLAATILAHGRRLIRVDLALSGDYSEYEQRISQLVVEDNSLIDSAPVNLRLVNNETSWMEMRRFLCARQFTPGGLYTTFKNGLHGILARAYFRRRVAEQGQMMWTRLALAASSWNNNRLQDASPTRLPANWAAILHTCLIADDTRIDADYLLFQARPVAPSLCQYTETFFAVCSDYIPVLSRLMMACSTLYAHWHGHQVYLAMKDAGLLFVIQNCSEHIDEVMAIPRHKNKDQAKEEKAYKYLKIWVEAWEKDVRECVRRSFHN